MTEILHVIGQGLHCPCCIIPLLIAVAIIEIGPGIAALGQGDTAALSFLSLQVQYLCGNVAVRVKES